MIRFWIEQTERLLGWALLASLIIVVFAAVGTVVVWRSIRTQNAKKVVQPQKDRDA